MPNVANNFKNIFGGYLCAIAQPRLKPMENAAPAPGRRDILTAVAVFALAVLLMLLFLSNKTNWTRQIAQAQHQADSLRENVMEKYETLRTYDSLATRALAENQYDPRAENGYRIYGLFKDPEGYYDWETLSAKFHISNPKSIKRSEADGEKWYVIPVKGVHFVRPGQSATTLARLYYANPADSVLITDFNGPLRSYQTAFVPFDK